MTMMKFLVASAILAVASAQKGIPAACTDICEPVMDTCMTAAAMSNPECADCKECLTTNKGGSGKGGSTGRGSGKGSKRSGGKGGKRASGSATGGTASMKPTMHKQCASNHRLVKTAYTNRVQAFMACVKAPGAACQGVYDLGCSARGPFYICGSNSSTTKDDAMTGSANGCVYPMALVKKAAQMMGSHGGKRGSKRSTGSAGKGGKRSTGTTGRAANAPLAAPPRVTAANAPLATPPARAASAPPAAPPAASVVARVASVARPRLRPLAPLTRGPLTRGPRTLSRRSMRKTKRLLKTVC